MPWFLERDFAEQCLVYKRRRRRLPASAEV
jgi:hypothetical protein